MSYIYIIIYMCVYPVSCSYLLTSTLLVAPHPNLAWKSKAGRVFHRQPPDPSIDFWMKKRELAGKQTVTGQLQVAWSFWDPLKKRTHQKFWVLSQTFRKCKLQIHTQIQRASLNLEWQLGNLKVQLWFLRGPLRWLGDNPTTLRGGRQEHILATVIIPLGNSKAAKSSSDALHKFAGLIIHSALESLYI